MRNEDASMRSEMTIKNLERGRKHHEENNLFDRTIDEEVNIQRTVKTTLI